MTTRNKIYFGENLDVLASLEDESVDLIYVDPPYNTGRKQTRTTLKMTSSDQGDRIGFGDRKYRTEKGKTLSFNDCYANYVDFVYPRLWEAHRVLKPTGSLFIHLDYREVHYVKVYTDTIFGRSSFMNEIIWAYDFGARSKTRWPAKHDNILWYAKDPKDYTFNYDQMDRIPYMAPGLVGKEKAARGKTPTDCYSSDTEVLTNEGWVLFSELQKHMLVATVTPSNTIKYTTPVKYHKYLYEGEMVEIKSKTINLCVTPTHSIYCKKKHKSEYVFIEAQDIKENIKTFVSLPNKLKWVGEDKKIFDIPEVTYRVKSQGKPLGPLNAGDWCEFVGWYVSEGSCISIADRKEVIISQKKVYNRRKICALLDCLGIHYWKNNCNIIISNKQLFMYMKKFGTSASTKRLLPEYLNLSVPLLERLYSGLMGGDGNIKRVVGQQDQYSYFTSSNVLANQVHELIIKLGYNGSTSYITAEEMNKNLHTISGKLVRANHGKHIIYRRVAKESTIWPSRHMEYIPYKDYVYCVTVEPYHTLIVRRGGRSSVCGNCWWHTIVPTNGSEKTGYPTQKPLGILKRLVSVHSNPGDLVLDFFCGSGTTGEAAGMLDRSFFLADNNEEAIEISMERLARFQPERINLQS